MTTALYRRYRPESFGEMIGQSQVTEPLMTALRSDRVGHAYLFSGPRGCGKTTSARILARCLNCAAGPTDTPCGTCDSCVELSRAGGGSLDVVEIDAASHNGVDDARDLRERAVFAPARDRFKIFILDEAHMVTPQGFNALLIVHKAFSTAGNAFTIAAGSSPATNAVASGATLTGGIDPWERGRTEWHHPDGYPHEFGLTDVDGNKVVLDAYDAFDVTRNLAYFTDFVSGSARDQKLAATTAASGSDQAALQDIYDEVTDPANWDPGTPPTWP